MMSFGCDETQSFYGLIKKEVVIVNHANTISEKMTELATFKTVNKCIAKIWNAIASVLGFCVQGAAKFSIEGKEVYISRYSIQKAFPQANLLRHAFLGTPQANKEALSTAAFKYFDASYPKA